MLMNDMQVGREGVLVIGEMSVRSMEEMRKDFCPRLIQSFLENIDRKSSNDGNRELISVFHKPHRKGRPFKAP